MMRSLFLFLVVLAVSAAAYGQKAQTMTIKVFFHDENLNPNMQDCTKAFPTTRSIPKTTSVARAALDELFKGTTEEERKKGFWAFDPESTTGIVKGLRVKNGAAYLNFTKLALEKLGNATTSCGAGFFPMVEGTLTQFPSIKKVYYAIEGDTNEFYEWAQVGECPYRKHCARSNFQ